MILNTFIRSRNIKFGDYILFQEYEQDKYIDGQYNYRVSKPIMCIYVNSFAADQTIGFNYLKWLNDYTYMDDTPELKTHIEWVDYINILGHWSSRPTWKEILKAYRTQNIKTLVNSNEINWKLS